MRKIILNYYKIIKENKQEFYNIFGVSLEKYFNSILGFNLTKFDKEVIKSENNESIKDKVFKKYGKGGVDIIVNLL